MGQTRLTGQPASFSAKYIPGAQYWLELCTITGQVGGIDAR